ncbi:MAG: hypothetical protein MZV70_41935 [Desulfobacterales bacterium]|nr:hypothetical protein [Desulfobacterales bacterium]
MTTQRNRLTLSWVLLLLLCSCCRPPDAQSGAESLALQRRDRCRRSRPTSASSAPWRRFNAAEAVRHASMTKFLPTLGTSYNYIHRNEERTSPSLLCRARHRHLPAGSVHVCDHVHPADLHGLRPDQRIQAGGSGAGPRRSFGQADPPGRHPGRQERLFLGAQEPKTAGGRPADRHLDLLPEGGRREFYKVGLEPAERSPAKPGPARQRPAAADHRPEQPGDRPDAVQHGPAPPGQHAGPARRCAGLLQLSGKPGRLPRAPPRKPP